MLKLSIFLLLLLNNRNLYANGFCEKVITSLMGLKKMERNIDSKIVEAKKVLKDLQSDSSRLKMWKEKMIYTFRHSDHYRDYYDKQPYDVAYYTPKIHEVRRVWSFGRGFHYEIKILFLYDLKSYFKDSKIMTFKFSNNDEILESWVEDLTNYKSLYAKELKELPTGIIMGGRGKDGAEII